MPRATTLTPVPGPAVAGVGKLWVRSIFINLP